jgi:hypothetical protein
MGVQFDLTGQVKQDQVFFAERFNSSCKEIEILKEEFKAIDQAAVRPKGHFFHNIFEADEVFDVEIWLVGEVVGCWVKVDVETTAARMLEVLDHSSTEGSLKHISFVAMTDLIDEINLASASWSHD